jgi:hypothetical protein
MLAQFQINKLNQRITVLEEAVFKKVKRLKATEAQRFLILHHLGLTKPLRDLEISQNQKDLLVSVLLDIDPNNAKKFLVETSKKDRPLLETISNYLFLSEFFEKVKLEKHHIEAERILNRLRADKEK